jgi:hypothetical protein
MTKARLLKTQLAALLAPPPSAAAAAAAAPVVVKKKKGVKAARAATRARRRADRAAAASAAASAAAAASAPAAVQAANLGYYTASVRGKAAASAHALAAKVCFFLLRMRFNRWPPPARPPVSLAGRKGNTAHTNSATKTQALGFKL